MTGEPTEATFSQYRGVIRKPTPGIETDSEIEIDRLGDGWTITVYRNVGGQVLNPSWEVWADNWEDVQDWYQKWETDWRYK